MGSIFVVIYAFNVRSSYILLGVTFSCELTFEEKNFLNWMYYLKFKVATITRCVLAFRRAT